MNKIFSYIYILCSILTFSTHLSASPWTSWIEFPTDPIYNPIPVSDGEDYFPYVVFNENQFDGNGDAFLYKMWHAGADANGSIAVSYSNDGINWTLKGETNLTPAFHAVILYDKNGFGVSGKPYRMWYWTGTPSSTDVGVIQYSQSNDGITWDVPQPITQDPGSPLVTGTDPFYQLYGPGFVIYNPSATSTPGLPYTFPYVMFYDIADVAQTTHAESIALAYSSDGLNWFRYGSQPILIPSGNIATDWDATHLFRPSIIISQGVYHMFYSGSNQYIDPLTTVVYAHGIGHASSSDGITWTKDSDNPIFIYSNGVAWRDTRTYTPFVLFDPFCNSENCTSCFAKMWFTGGTGLTTGIDQGIGYATLQCPFPPAPLPPSNFVGVIKKNKFLTKTECILEAKWNASPSANVILYRIYKEGNVVKEILATSPLVFVTCLRHCSAKGYEIAAVGLDNLESSHIKLSIVD